MSIPLEVPDEVTFEQAIALTQSLLSYAEAAQTLEPEIAAAIAQLVKTENGARGFFVTYLTSEASIADNPPQPLVEALRSHPEVVSELLVKNLAMSASQAVFHRRHQKEDMAQASEQVRQRTACLIQLLELPQVRDRLQQLLETITTGEGSYKTFLERWSYDLKQKQAMSHAIERAIARAK